MLELQHVTKTFSGIAAVDFASRSYSVCLPGHRAWWGSIRTLGVQ